MTTELSVTRYIAAPPGKVWEVLANRQDEWWCPRPWASKTVALDPHPGGRWATRMSGPNGEVNDTDGTILEWEEGTGFTATDAVVRDGDGRFAPSGPFMIGSWRIEPEGEGTRYTATARHWTEEAARQHADMGFEAGWAACADQLAALAEGD